MGRSNLIQKHQGTLMTHLCSLSLSSMDESSLSFLYLKIPKKDDQDSFIRI